MAHAEPSLLDWNAFIAWGAVGARPFDEFLAARA
jgi:hypothetical protein